MLDAILKVVQICAYIATACAALGALKVYRSNARHERARWAESMYVKFFEESSLKRVREVVDSDANNGQVEEYVTKEPPEWTDYLNFIEFVAYLQSSKQLLDRDVQALFGYYIECLRKHALVLEYVQKKEKGFDYLRRLLLHA